MSADPLHATIDDYFPIYLVYIRNSVWCEEFVPRKSYVNLVADEQTRVRTFFLIRYGYNATTLISIYTREQIAQLIDADLDLYEESMPDILTFNII